MRFKGVHMKFFGIVLIEFSLWLLYIGLKSTYGIPIIGSLDAMGLIGIIIITGIIIGSRYSRQRRELLDREAIKRRVEEQKEIERLSNEKQLAIETYEKLKHMGNIPSRHQMVSEMNGRHYYMWRDNKNLYLFPQFASEFVEKLVIDENIDLCEKISICMVNKISIVENDIDENQFPKHVVMYIKTRKGDCYVERRFGIEDHIKFKEILPDKIQEDLFSVIHSPAEYYQNGNRKNYESEIHHKKLNKKVRVKAKNYSDYKEKFNLAIEKMEMEWRVSEMNRRAKENEIMYKNFHKEDFGGAHFDPQELMRKRKFESKIEETKSFSMRKPKSPVLLERREYPNQPDSNHYGYYQKLNVVQKVFYPFMFPVYKRGRKKFETAKIEYKKKCDEVKDANEYIASKNKELLHAHEMKMVEYSDAKERYRKEIEIKKLSAKNELKKMEDDFSKWLRNYESGNAKDLCEYIKQGFEYKANEIKVLKSIKCEFEFEESDSTLIANIVLPNEKFYQRIESYKYIKSNNSVKKYEYKSNKFNQMVVEAYHSLYLMIVNLIFYLDSKSVIENIVLNGIYGGVDNRTGKEFQTCIMSSKIPRKEFMEINLNRINPVETYKHLRGRGMPNPANIQPVEPIRNFEKSKYKLIETNDIISSLSAETNLAAMSWQDFENLIKDVFQLEFAEEKIEIKNTQHSNDGGIDIVAFNPNPYSGGDILLQAKRYTNVVSPEPVRALKGSIEDKRAIRGILATTSDFGPASREFANEHNITLINGNQLVQLCKKHGYDFHIDLEQAKLVNTREN